MFIQQEKQGIEEVNQVVTDFVEKKLGVKEVKLIKVVRASDEWEIEAEGYVESAFLKSLGLPTRVQDRIVYHLKLDENLNVQSYERNSQGGVSA